MSGRIGELFAGYGGLGMGVMDVIDAEVAWFSEVDKAPSKILAHHWPDVPNHGDIRTIDWATVEPVDILTGGFPCQDVSLAGARAGFTPTSRSGLWSEFARAIAALQPELVVIENVRGLLSAQAVGSVEPDPWGVGDGATRPVVNALGAVLGDLAGLGYDAEWCGVRAADAGAPHGRFRVFIVAHRSGLGWGEGWTESARCEGRPPTQFCSANVANAGSRELAIEQVGQSGRSRSSLAERHHAVASNSDNAGRSEHWRPIAVRPELIAAQHTGPAASDSCGERFGQHTREPFAEETGKTSRDLADRPSGRRSAIDWGPYSSAIERWEAVTRPAPTPTLSDGKNGSHRLSARFVEWLMGLPEGHVTDVGLSRNEQLKALGNGVVPQQAALAVSYLLSRELVS